MKTVVIKKNGNVIKSFESSETKLQSTFNKAVNMAGGMWNGVDTFTVSII
jgi:hypothetical protein